MSCTEKISLMTYNAEKNLTPLYVGENISNSREVWEKILPQTKSVKSPLPHSPTNVQWSCQPFRGWGKERIWHLCICHSSTKWLARDHDVVVFKTKVLHFKIENTPIKDTNGKKKFKRMLSFFLWSNESFSLWNCSSRNSTLFSTRRIGTLGLFWTNQGSEVSEDTWGTFRTLWSEKSSFLKRNFCIYKGFMDVFLYFDIGVKEKPQNVHLKLIFLPCARPIYLRERNDLTCLTRIAF